MLGGVATGVVLVTHPFQKARADLLTYPVRYQKLEMSVLERGTLESAENFDVFCRVKAKVQGSTGASTTIKSIIDDGSNVKKGDLLVELDDSALLETLKQQKITLDQALAARVKAETDYEIGKSQNESDIKTAEVNIELAELDLKKFIEGEFPQSLKDVVGRISMAESDLEMQRDRTSWMDRMVKKGYQTSSQAQAEHSKLDSTELALKKVQEELRVLQNYTKLRTETDLRSKLAEAKRALVRIKSQAKAKELQTRTDQTSKQSVHQQEEKRYHEIEDEIKKCRIFSPQEGMVVYVIPDQARFGSGSQQSGIMEGEPVREGQKLMRIPNLQKMRVAVRIHEAMVSRVREGQPVQVRIDAYPGRVLHGHVSKVATVASQQDWLSADVKVYQSQVTIDGVCKDLKPGMSAEVTITIGHPLDHVLAIPIQAIIGSSELADHRQCYVNTPDGPQIRDIVVGMANERMAEVKSGLQEGEEVVINPRVLVGDKVTTREADTGKKESGKGRKQRGGPPPDMPPDKPGQPGPGGPGKPPGNPKDMQKKMKDKTERFENAPVENRKE